MRKGDTGADVRDLQHRLNTAGLTTDRDGWFGDATEAAVRAFQLRVGLVADGIAGPKTLAALQQGKAPGTLLRHADIEAAAERLGVSVAAVMAVNEVESAGTGFLPDGRPKILFERHVMHRLLDKSGRDADAMAAKYPNIVNPKRGGYAGGAAEYGRLGTAMGIDMDCALQSASFGLFQIMGFHFADCGYGTPPEFYSAMRESEGKQLAAFAAFIESQPDLHKALKARKWAEFAKIYNGPAFRENLYDTKLARAYERHAALLKEADEA